jgi:hypothetical protein
VWIGWLDVGAGCGSWLMLWMWQDDRMTMVGLLGLVGWRVGVLALVGCWLGGWSRIQKNLQKTKQKIQ